MKYFKFRWNETRGDEFDDWGFSTWYSQVGGDGFPIRQIEVYDNGNILKYSEEHLDDEFGGLGDQPIAENVANNNTISKEEFEEIWAIEDFLNK